MASTASTVSTSPRYFVPSAATNGARSPTRSTNPRNTSPDSVRFGFSSGRPISVGRCSNSVNTELRATGALPTRVATRLAAPIDNPSDSLISHTPFQRVYGRGPVTGRAAVDAVGASVAGVVALVVCSSRCWVGGATGTALDGGLG